MKVSPKAVARAVVGVCGGLVAAVFALWFWVHTANEDGLRAQIDVLMRERLGIERYEIERESLDAEGFDPGGDWWVVLDPAPADLRARLEKAGFGPKHPSDRGYFQFVARTQFGYQTVADDTEAFAAEMPLGEDSTCPREGFGCHIVVVFKDGDPNVFVLMWKI